VVTTLSDEIDPSEGTPHLRQVVPFTNNFVRPGRAHPNLAVDELLASGTRHRLVLDADSLNQSEVFSHPGQEKA
jgi:hypothetical protein